jgi:hypothetical protein
MVHFPRFAFHTYEFSMKSSVSLLKGLPHSDICGSMPARDSPQLFAACHVLLRLWLPRHPPYALCSLTINFSFLSPHLFSEVRTPVLLLSGCALSIQFSKNQTAKHGQDSRPRQPKRLSTTGCGSKPRKSVETRVGRFSLFLKPLLVFSV